jgi:hypothetical protein
MRRCATCRYAVLDQTPHCRAPGMLTALAPTQSSFPVIAGWLWCGAHKYSITRLLKQLWLKVYYGKTDCEDPKQNPNV